MEMKNGKPAVFVNTDFAVFLGNTGTDELIAGPGELFGFGVGTYEMQIVSGPMISIQCSEPHVAVD